MEQKRGIKFLLELFSEHIGEDNGITHEELFKTLFGYYPDNYEKYELFYKQKLLQALLTYLRKRTMCFIVHKNGKYFVVTKREEASEYLSHLEHSKKKIDFMIEKCNLAITEEFYKKMKRRKLLVQAQ